MENIQLQAKNVLIYAAVLALIVGSYAAVVYSRAYSQSVGPASYRSFGVTGVGKVVAIPDVAVFNFSVVTEGGKDLAKLQADNTAKTNAAIDYLKKNGVEAKDIKTISYSVNPRTESVMCPVPAIYGGAPNICPPPSIAGYQVVQNVEVKIRDFKKSGTILQGVVAAGANQVTNINFTVDDIEKVKSEARGLAIANARAQAQTVAQAGGFSLGKLISVDDLSAYPMDAYGGMVPQAMSARVEKVAEPVLEPGTQDISVRISARYEIRD